MKKCPFCSAEILDDADFCLYCMRPLTEKTAVEAKHKKSYRGIVLLTVLVVLFTCTVVLLTVVFGTNIIKNFISKNSVSSAVNATVRTVADDSKKDDDSSENETAHTNDKSQESSHLDVVGPSVTTSSEDKKTSSSKLSSETSSVTSSAVTSSYNSVPDRNVSTENKTTDNKTPDKSTESSSEGSTSTESSAPTTTTPPSTPALQPQPEVVKQTWSTSEVDGGIEITGIENYNTSGNYEIPSFIDGKEVVGIGLQAFYYEENLKSITLPDTLKYIDEQAFANCNSLNKIVIPAGVRNIKTNAFMSCKVLSEIYIKSSEISISNYAFSSSHQRSVPLTIYAPPSAMSKTAAIAYNAEYVEWYG